MCEYILKYISKSIYWGLNEIFDSFKLLIDYPFNNSN